MRPLVLFLALALSAHAQRLPHRLRPTVIDSAAALQRAAHDLFRPPRGTVLELKLASRRMEHALGCEIESWQVASDEAGSPGTFLRFRSWPLPESTVDLALRLEDGVVRGVAAVRPVILAGTGFPQLPAALASMGDLPLVSWAPAAARLFGALAYVETCLAGAKTGDGPGEKTAAAAIDALEKLRPGLLPGAPFPEIDVQDDAQGRFRTDTTFSGRSALVVAASVKHEASRALLARVGAYARENPGRFAVIWVLADRPAAIAAYRERGGRLEGIVLPDPDRTVRDALRVNVLPSVFGFDSKRKLVAFMRAPFPAADADLFDALDDFPIFSSVSPGAAAPSPSPSPSVAAAPFTTAVPAVSAERLAAAGRALLAPKDARAAKGFVVVADRTVSRWTEGWSVQRLEARDADGNVVGTLARVSLFTDPASRVDLACRLDGGAIAGVEPLAPLKLAGRDATALAALVCAVSHRPPETFGAALARVLEGLASVPRPPAPRPSTRLELKLGTPALPPGLPLPELSGADPEGHLHDGSAWKNRAALVVVTDRSLPPELVPAALAAARGRPLLFVVTASAAEARALVPAHAGVHVLVDPDGHLATRLRPPSLPYLYATDARGAIAARAAWVGLASLTSLK